MQKDEWIYYLKNNDIPDDFTAPGLDEARKRLKYDKLSEQEKRDYEFHLEQTLYESNSIETALMKGEAKGFAKGKAERDRLQIELKTAQAGNKARMDNMALFLHRSGESLKNIISLTGLTQAEVKVIIEKATDK